MTHKLVLLLTLCPLLFAAGAQAGPDLFIGDTAIYSGSVASVKPNILFVIDNSAFMSQKGMSTPYNPAKTYANAGYAANTVYVLHSSTGGGGANYGSYISSLGSVTCAAATAALTTSGVYYGPMKNDGGCGNSNTQNGNYYLGNLLNYNAAVPQPRQANTAYAVGDVVIPSAGSATYSYTCTVAGTSGSAAPVWPTASGATVTDGGVTWQIDASSILDMVQATVEQVATGARDSVNVGLMVFGDNNHGGKVLRPVLDVSNATGQTNFNNLSASLSGIDLLSGFAQPVNEAHWDAGVYFRGQNGDSQLKISSDTAAYASPITATCQKNYVILLTTGNSDDNTQTKTRLTDLNGSCSNSSSLYNSTSCIGDVGDAASYSHQADNSSTLAGIQRLNTHVIQLLSPTVPLLQNTAAAGQGNYYLVWNTAELTTALLGVMNNIVLEVNTSFVAPVVPVSPENRTYSGSRVYMGFFKPITESYWHGNLKKYGVNAQNILTDRNNAVACYTDNDDDGIDDVLTPQTILPSGAVNGSFRSTASSFWSNTQDAGTVEDGGAGQVLDNRDLAASPRKIYTYLGTSANLTDASNNFATGNAALTPAVLAVASSAAASSLINFIHGTDSYDEDGNGNFTERRAWSVGDILHSRPYLVNYASYAFTAANEANCSVNKAILYVGANDGMFHAIRDCDGSEAWAFIPPDMLGNLKHLSSSNHAYFVDSTPSVYTYDGNNDGAINTASGDKVVLVFGARRGGGRDAAPTSGSYYALDVSDPAAPRLLWRISNQTAGFEELAETWSEPKLVKMQINSSGTTVDKIVAFVGAGYDNVHEDTRFGNTQSFTNAASVVPSDVGDGNLASGGSTVATALANPKGRGIYAIELATLVSGVPSFTNSGAKIWGYVYGAATNESAVLPASATNSLLQFSIPSEVGAIDANSDGYADTLYVGDTGGRVWKFNVADTSAANWRGIRLFDLSSGTSVAGRKFFYKPSVVVEAGYNMLYLGSGDREHPLNRHSALIDRMYALKDSGQTTLAALNETHLTDVTSDLIQTTSVASGASSIGGILSTLSASYGWYVSLDQRAGEKVLAAPTVFNKVAYFTTFTPNATASADPCNPGNLGASRLYALDYKNGSAVLNYDLSNDSTNTANTYATSTPGKVLLRSDRETTLGSGIASGIVMMISPGGGLRALIGVGGLIAGENPKKGGSVLPLYWRQK